MTCRQCGAPIEDGERRYQVVIVDVLNDEAIPVLAVVCLGCYA